MTGEALVLTFHAVEAGPPPLCVEPKLFGRQLDAIVASGSKVLTVRELAEALRTRTLPRRAVVLTFDDAFASAATDGATMLAERGLRATFFPVAAHVGGLNDWASQPSSAPRLRLASLDELRALGAAGFEVGSHGLTHAPLAAAAGDVLEREILGSKEALEAALALPVSSFAYPYGAEPPAAPPYLAGSYAAVCTTRMDVLTSASDPLALPRVDAHYLRRSGALARALEHGLTPYLRARRIGSSVRRAVFSDLRRGSTD